VVPAHVGVYACPGQTGRLRHYVFNLSVRLSVRPSVRYRTCEHDVLKTTQLIFTPIGTRGPPSNGMKRSTLAVQRSKVRGQGHSRQKIYCGGLAEASFTSHLGRVAFQLRGCFYRAPSSPLCSAWTSAHTWVLLPINVRKTSLFLCLSICLEFSSRTFVGI